MSKFYKELNELTEKNHEEQKSKIAETLKNKNLTDEQLREKLISLGAYWGIIKLILNFVKIFTGAKADEKIDEIIAWGDSIFE